MAEKSVRSILKKGTPMWAQVVSGRQVPDERPRSVVFGATMAEYELDVYPESGSSYRVTIRQYVPDHLFERAVPGTWVGVGVDRRDPSKVAIEARAAVLKSAPRSDLKWAPVK